MRNFFRDVWVFCRQPATRRFVAFVFAFGIAMRDGKVGDEEQATIESEFTRWLNEL